MRILGLGLIVVLSGWALAAEPADEATRTLVAALKKAVSTDYPKATVEVAGRSIRIEHDARDFQVHHLGKGGRWMDAVTERGPKRGGLVLLAEVVDGPYRSQKAVGVFDEWYYEEHRMVRVAEAGDRHVVVRLRLPTRTRMRAPKGFAAKVERALAGFGSPPRR